METSGIMTSICRRLSPYHTVYKHMAGSQHVYSAKSRQITPGQLLVNADKGSFGTPLHEKPGLLPFTHGPD